MPPIYNSSCHRLNKVEVVKLTKLRVRDKSHKIRVVLALEDLDKVVVWTSNGVASNLQTLDRFQLEFKVYGVANSSNSLSSSQEASCKVRVNQSEEEFLVKHHSNL